MAEISVIVPVYKVEAYLDRCVGSLLAQTFRDIEVILVDDGSPDNCPRMCDAWARKDSRVKVIHKENGGLSSARNAGLTAAKGAYIAFVDSDDWVEPEMLGHLLGLLRENPGTQIAQCGLVMCRDMAPVTQPAKEHTRILDRKGMLDYFFRVHGEPTNTGVWNKLYARDILQGFSFVDTINEDVEASYEVFNRAEKMVMSDLVFYHYFVNTTGITRSGFARRDLDYLAVWDRIVARTAQENPDYSHYAEMGRKRAGFTLLAKMLLRGYDRKDPELRGIKRELKRQTRRDFWDLMGWKMPLSRKVLLVLVCI